MSCSVESVREVMGMGLDRRLIEQILTAALLLINTWQDCRKKEILPWSLCFTVVAAAGLQLYCQERTMEDLLGGAALGGVLLCVSWVSRSSVGIGDGLLVCVTGICLGFKENLWMVMGALLLCAVFSGGLLLFGVFTNRSISRKKQIPFVPFLLVSHLCGVLF